MKVPVFQIQFKEVLANFSTSLAAFRADQIWPAWNQISGMNPVDWSRLPVDPTGVRGGVEPDVAPGKPALGIGMAVAPRLGSHRCFGNRAAPGFTGCALPDRPR